MSAARRAIDRELILDRVRAVILGGGRGERLYPLTQNRAKPAVAVAGNYRLIDITLSNCINSEIRNIFILTQFNSDSLHRHISTAYRFDHFSRGWVQVLAAQQTTENNDWFQGTADAVRKTLRRIVDGKPENVIILSGDHLYRMDYRDLLAEHMKRELDITISTIPVARNACHQFGILRINNDADITEFVEKPENEQLLDDLRVPAEVFNSQGINPEGREHIASMGIYIFRTHVLKELIENTSYADFGKEVLPSALGRYRMGACMFDGYWEDIGTIRAFYEANIALTEPCPAFNFFDEYHPMFTRPRFLPGSKVNGATIRNSIISDGAIIDDAEICNSVVGVRSIIRGGCQIKRSIIMGADFYEDPNDSMDPPIGVGHSSVIHNAIIDKHARIGDNVRIVNERGVMHETGENYCIRDGITIVPRRGVIPSGTII